MYLLMIRYVVRNMSYDSIMTCVIDHVVITKDAVGEGQGAARERERSGWVGKDAGARERGRNSNA